MINFIKAFFNVKKIAYICMIATCASFGGLSAMADILKVNEKILCSNTGAVSVKNNVYSVACRDGVRPSPAPIPGRGPAPSRPPNNTPAPTPPVANAKCGVPEPNLIIETFTGKGFEEEYTLPKGSTLVVSVCKWSCWQYKEDCIW